MKEVNRQLRGGCCLTEKDVALNKVSYLPLDI